MVGLMAGSLVVLMWSLLALQSTLVSSTPVVERGVRRGDAASSSAIDEDDLTGEADLQSPPAVTFGVHKRPWGRNNVAAWGKRSAADKRRWGQKSMALWGKRSYDDDDDDYYDSAEYPLTKRRWGQKHMAIWGKRAAVGRMLKYDADQLEAQKRKWGQKNLALWG